MKPVQEYLTPEDMLAEELTSERLLSAHLLVFLAKRSVEGCHQLIDEAPDVSDEVRQDTHAFVEGLVLDGEVRR